MLARDLAATGCRHQRSLILRTSWTTLLISIVYITLISLIGPSQSYSASSHGGHTHGHHQQHQHSAPVSAVPSFQYEKVLIPNLHPHHYQYWLKNHPRAAKIFGDICQRAGPNLVNANNSDDFHKLHTNLYFEDMRYLQYDYGKSVLRLICSKIADISKSCWGYENGCHDIYMMPECRSDSGGKREEQDKIDWFSQADFGYILDRARELSKYCAPEKRINPTEVSSFECTKHFTTCRGYNLFIKFDRTANQKRPAGSAYDPSHVLNELGGWGCDLQTARIKEESGLDDRLQSWYGELKNYGRVEHLKPKESCDHTITRPVFFVKIDSTSNLDDYLGTFVNLYATIHLNNRFSDNNQIILWADRLPRLSKFETLWYAFSRFAPISIGELAGTTMCFNKFIFAMPPKMIDGLHVDKPLVENCNKSGLYDAFRKHVLHRLATPDLYNQDYHRKKQGKLNRVVILSRAFKEELRNILNQDELMEAIKKHASGDQVEIVEYNSQNFMDVYKLVINSDILIGLHGPGLAYSLFLPDYAGLIELHDFGKDRYHKLARLRGISYFKPSDEQREKGFVKKVQVPKGSKEWSQLNERGLLDHDEFSNYQIDVNQFIELFARARKHVLKTRDEHFLHNEELLPDPVKMRPTPAPASPTNPPKPSETIVQPPPTTGASSTTHTTPPQVQEPSTTTTTTTTTTPSSDTSSPALPPPERRDDLLERKLRATAKSTSDSRNEL